MGNCAVIIPQEWSVRSFTPRVLQNVLDDTESNWKLAFSPSWVTADNETRRICTFSSSRIVLWNATNVGNRDVKNSTLLREADLALGFEESLLQFQFYDGRSAEILVGAVRCDKPRVVNKSPEGENDDFQVDFLAACEIRIWNKHFEVLKLLEMDTSIHKAPICSTLACSPFCIYVGDTSGVVHAWGKISMHDVEQISPKCTYTARFHDGLIVAMHADPHFCYTMGEDNAVVISVQEGLAIACRIDLDDPIVVFNPTTGTSFTSYVRSGVHLMRPCSRWAMSQSYPNRRGVTSHGPRGFVFATATNDLNHGLLLKFDMNRDHPLVVQCTFAYSTPVQVCVSGPYDNGPIITIGEHTRLLCWDFHSLQLIVSMSIAEAIYSINSIVVHPQECFYSVNTHGQISVWGNR